MRASPLVLLSLLAAGTAVAAEKPLKNDTWDGTGAINRGAKFGEYEGAGVILEGATADYPLTLVAVEVLAPPYSGSGGIAGFLLDIWKTSGGAPTTNVGDLFTSGVQLTASLTQVNRFDLSPPLTVTSGKIFVGLRYQLNDTATENVTIALDQGPVAAGKNFLYAFQSTGGWVELTSTSSLSANWIIRGILKVPDVPPTVTAITPNSAEAGTGPTVTITGTRFEFGATASLGSTALSVSSVSPPTSLTAKVPNGLAPGVYDVKVTNPSGLTGTLPNGFTVLGTDGGTPGGPDASTSGGADGGGAGPSAELTLTSINPADGYTASDVPVSLVGTGFQTGVQALIGTTTLKEPSLKSAAFLEGIAPAGMQPGVYDVTVVNPDGKQAKLAQAFTVHEGEAPGAAESGCGCSDTGAAATAWMGMTALVALRRRTRR